MIKTTTKYYSLWNIYIPAVAISFIYVLLTYSPGFLSGTGPYWDLQADDVGTYITGLRYYIRDPWRFPLFYSESLNFPDGGNIIFTDSLPLMALFAKVIYKLTGIEWNYFGFWFIISNVLYGLSIVALLNSLKIYSRRLCCIALCFGFSVFPYIFQTFHIALSSHFLVIAAISLYFYSQEDLKPKTAFCLFMTLTITSLLVHFYLFVMVSFLFAASFMDLYAKKRISLRSVFLYGGYSIFILFGVFVCIGYISFDRSKSYAALGSAGIYSMNICSPVTPVYSSLIKSLIWYKDPTKYQFSEGMNYLGISVIVLCIFIGLKYTNKVKQSIRNHPWLFILCVGLFLFSLSNKIYFSQYLVLDIPLIPGVETLYKTFQSAGRFFWINVYILTLIPLVVLWKNTTSRKIAFYALLVLALVQNIEIWDLRQNIYKKTKFAPNIEYLSSYEQLVQKHDLILVSQQDAVLPGSYRNTVRTFYFLTGKFNVPINYCYTARRLRHSTSLEQLIDTCAESDKAVLIVIPQERYSAIKVDQFPFVSNIAGVMILSNKAPLPFSQQSP